MNTFKFGARSESKLVGVHPDLVKVCRRALTTSQVDFGILQGVRTLEEEQANFSKGLSRIAPDQSRHLRGLAVDVGAYENGVLSWNWKLYEFIAEEFSSAGMSLSIPIRWGGAWDVNISDLLDSGHDMHTQYVHRYMQEHPGRKPLSDGGHFELPTKEYP